MHQAFDWTPDEIDELLTPEHQEQLASEILNKLLHCRDTGLLREWKQRLDAEMHAPVIGDRAWLEGVLLKNAKGFPDSEGLHA